MDSSPFFEFNLLDLKDSAIHELSKFRKDSFDFKQNKSILKFSMGNTFRGVYPVYRWTDLRWDENEKYTRTI